VHFIKADHYVVFCELFILFFYQFLIGTLEQRDYREGWPLLTVETEVNGDSKRTNERGPSLVGSLGLSCRYKRFVYTVKKGSRVSRLQPGCH
jgi:hypothetical protein